MARKPLGALALACRSPAFSANIAYGGEKGRNSVTKLLGDAALDEDGVLNGWCWDPARPEVRLMVEILANDEVIATIRAAQHRDDLQGLKYGDGRHGFLVTLSRQVALAGRGVILSAREQESGHCFWRTIFGDVALPEGFAQRLAAARDALGDMAQDQALMPRRPGQVWRTALGALGQELQEQAGTRPALALPAVAEPRLSLVAPAAAQPVLEHMLERLAPNLAAARAEVILAGYGPPCANLTCVAVPGLTGAAALNFAARVARGAVLGFLQPEAGNFDMPDMDGAAFLVPSGLAADAERIAPGLAAGIEIGPVPRLPGLRLAAARVAFTALAGFDADMDDGAGLAELDLLLRAREAGFRVRAWYPPWAMEAPRAAPANAQAGRQFVQRWVQGLV